jgi:large subunit ribosomal protein L15
VKLHELSPAKGSRRPRKRVGRGQGAGQGKTSGRGQKGQGSRSSVGLPTGFEGGQMPLKQRLPKLRGFHNRWRREYVVVNLGKLVRFEKDTVVDPDVLTEAGLIPRASSPVKVLAAGHLGHALTLRVHRISAAARTAVESAGGSVELLGPQPAAEGAGPVGKRAKRRADAFVARAELLSRPATPREPAAKPDGKKRAKGTGADATSEAKPARDRAERGGKRKTSRDDSAPAPDAPAPDAEQDAAQDSEAETEDTE